jgi:hypothetical protein
LVFADFRRNEARFLARRNKPACHGNLGIAWAGDEGFKDQFQLPRPLEEAYLEKLGLGYFYCIVGFNRGFCKVRSEVEIQLALIKVFPYYGFMNITLSLDDDLVKEVRKIAVERDTTLTGLVRSYLQGIAEEHAKSGRKRRELEALRESFEKYQFNIGKHTWTRADLHERR